jgi:hypothetical protein
MDGHGQCSFCGKIPGFGGGETDTVHREETARGDTAWERRSSWLDFPAIFEMIRAVLIEPTATFRRMKTSGDLASPMIFAVLLGTIGVLGGLFWNLMMQSMGFLSDSAAAEGWFLSTGILLTMAIFSPVLVLLGTFISSGILHVCLMITGGAKNGFEATYRVVCYATGATALFQLFPFCGGLIGGVWAIVAEVFGAREMHETTTGRALLAVLLPLLFCCACGILFLFFGLGAGLLAGLAGNR